jgi:hypothetical protein
MKRLVDPNELETVFLRDGRIIELPPYAANLYRTQQKRDTRWRQERGFPETACAWCGDSGFTWDELPDGTHRQTTDPCTACEPGQRLSRQVERDRAWSALVPKRMVEWTVETCPNSVLRFHVIDWLASDPIATGRGLCIIGRVGGAKTSAAISALRELHDRGAHVRYTPVQDLIDGIQEGYQNRDMRHATPEHKRPLYQAEHAGVLLLDDLGAERKTEDAHKIIDGVLRERHDQMRPTIITSNLDKDEFKRLIGGRIISRLVEDMTFIVLDPATPDYRQKSTAVTANGRNA